MVATSFCCWKPAVCAFQERSQYERKRRRVQEGRGLSKETRGGDGAFGFLLPGLPLADGPGMLFLE
jgi:hypothetical protein